MIGGRAKPEHREIEVVSYPTMIKHQKKMNSAVTPEEGVFARTRVEGCDMKEAKELIIHISECFISNSIF